MKVMRTLTTKLATEKGLVNTRKKRTQNKIEQALVVKEFASSLKNRRLFAFYLIGIQTDAQPISVNKYQAISGYLLEVDAESISDEITYLKSLATKRNINLLLPETKEVIESLREDKVFRIRSLKQDEVTAFTNPSAVVVSRRSQVSEKGDEELSSFTKGVGTAGGAALTTAVVAKQGILTGVTLTEIWVAGTAGEVAAAGGAVGAAFGVGVVIGTGINAAITAWLSSDGEETKTLGDLIYEAFAEEDDDAPSPGKGSTTPNKHHDDEDDSGSTSGSNDDDSTDDSESDDDSNDDDSSDDSESDDDSSDNSESDDDGTDDSESSKDDSSTTPNPESQDGNMSNMLAFYLATGLLGETVRQQQREIDVQTGGSLREPQDPSINYEDFLALNAILGGLLVKLAEISIASKTGGHVTDPIDAQKVESLTSDLIVLSEAFTDPTHLATRVAATTELKVVPRRSF
jgi:hypothetical protein